MGSDASQRVYGACVPTDLGRALLGLTLGASVLVLWCWGMGVFVPSADMRLDDPLASAPSWQAAAWWSLGVVLIATMAPLLVVTARLVPVDSSPAVVDWVVPVGAGAVAWIAGWLDLVRVYHGLQPVSGSEYTVATSGSADDAWWEWSAAYPGHPIQSAAVGLAGVAVVVLWAWWRRWPDLVLTAAASTVALSMSVAVPDGAGGTGMLTPAPYDAVDFFWSHASITIVAGVALTGGTVMSCSVRTRASLRSRAFF